MFKHILRTYVKKILEGNACKERERKITSQNHGARGALWCGDVAMSSNIRYLDDDGCVQYS